MSAEPQWLSATERASWLRLLAVAELLPGILDSQLRHDSNLTLFEYQTLAMLSETPTRTLRMTELADRTNATLPRLSHVVTRLANRGLVQRRSCPSDGRATNVQLTDEGFEVLAAAAPGHVAKVRDVALDALSPEQVVQLGDIAESLLSRLDPDGRMTGTLRDVHDGFGSASTAARRATC